MRYLTTALFAFFFFYTSFSQDRKLSFKEIGWTITIPKSFKLTDSAEIAARNSKGLKAMEDATDIKGDLSTLVTLFAASKDHNILSSTIEPLGTITETQYAAQLKLVKEVVYKTFAKKATAAKIDSFSSIMTIDGLTFNKFRVTVSMKGKPTFNFIMLAKNYKDYDFGITYLYMDEKTKKEIEAALNESTFSK
jgi:hypothetical protein